MREQNQTRFIIYPSESFFQKIKNNNKHFAIWRKYKLHSFNNETPNSKYKQTPMKSLIGLTVGKLMVIKDNKSEHTRMFLCECDCGNSIKISQKEFQEKKVDRCLVCQGKQTERNNIYYLNYKGKRESLSYWSKETGLPYNYFLEEYKKGVRGKQVILNIKERMRFTTAFGETLPLSKWAKRSPHLSFPILLRRWEEKGLRGEDLFTIDSKVYKPSKNENARFVSSMNEVRKTFDKKRK